MLIVKPNELPLNPKEAGDAKRTRGVNFSTAHPHKVVQIKDPARKNRSQKQVSNPTNADQM